MAKSAGRRLLDGKRAKPFIIAGIVLALALTESLGGEGQSAPYLSASNVPRLTQPKPHLATAQLLADYDRRIAEFKPRDYTNEAGLRADMAKVETSIDGANITLTCVIWSIDDRVYFGKGPIGSIGLRITCPVELPPGWNWGTQVKILGTKEEAAKISKGDILTIRDTVRVPGKEDEPGERNFWMAHFSSKWASTRVMGLHGFDYTITPASQAAQTKSHAETTNFLADYQRRFNEIVGGTSHTAEAGIAAQKAALENVPLTLTCCITSVYAVAPTKEEPAGSIGLSLTNAAEAPGGWYGDPRVRIPGGAAQMAKIHLGDTLVIRGAGRMANREVYSPVRLRCYGLGRSFGGGGRTLEFADADYTIVPAAPAAKATPPSAAAKTSPTAAPPAKLP
jgi:hypothetical protein